MSGAPCVAVLSLLPRRYRFRLINMGCEANFFFAFDQHEIIVIEADGHSVEPVTVDVVQIFVGEYSFLIFIRYLSICPSFSAQRYSLVVCSCSHIECPRILKCMHVTSKLTANQNVDNYCMWKYLYQCMLILMYCRATYTSRHGKRKCCRWHKLCNLAVQGRTRARS